MSESDDPVRQAAQSPKKASDDAGSMEQHPLTEQIEADRYLASKAAAKKNGLGVKFAKLSPPSAE